jgi:hypothetical protein
MSSPVKTNQLKYNYKGKSLEDYQQLNNESQVSSSPSCPCCEKHKNLQNHDLQPIRFNSLKSSNHKSKAADNRNHDLYLNHPQYHNQPRVQFEPGTFSQKHKPERTYQKNAAAPSQHSAGYLKASDNKGLMLSGNNKSFSSFDFTLANDETSDDCSTTEEVEMNKSNSSSKNNPWIKRMNCSSSSAFGTNDKGHESSVNDKQPHAKLANIGKSSSIVSSSNIFYDFNYNTVNSLSDSDFFQNEKFTSSTSNSTAPLVLAGNKYSSSQTPQASTHRVTFSKNLN